MKFRTAIAGLFLLLASCLSSTQVLASQPSIWVTAYYPVWEQTTGMSPDKIDFSAITHLVHFAIVPRANGTIDDAVHGTLNAITPAQSLDVVTRGHAAGDKVLVCLGGANTGPSIGPVLADSVRPIFIDNLIDFIKARDYDGIDVDMEPIVPADEGNFVKFIHELRARMKSVNPKWLLTIPASGEPGDQPRLCATLQDDFDQINIQTYDLSGKWDGFKTWYNGSLYGDGPNLMTDTRPYPSVADKLKQYLDAGIPAAKLGIGIAFYGYSWNGVSGPRQSIQGVSLDTLGYNTIMDKVFQPSVYHWDTLAHAPYLSIPAANGAAEKFVSYDDPRLTAEKVIFARTHHLGGVIIWEIGDGYRADQPAGHKDGLLQVVKRAAHEPLAAAAATVARR